MEYMDLNKQNPEEKEPKKKLSKKKKAAIIICSALAFLIIGGFGGFQILKAVGKSNLKKSATSFTPSLASDGGSADDLNQGIIHYNGKKYKYNDSIVTILCMGIDTDRTMEETEIRKAGHADSMFLTVLDEKNKKMSLIGISRDSVTEIDIPYSSGNINYSMEGIVAHQYAYGDGKELSGKLTTKTVSEMLYNLPIHAYAAIHLEGVGIINDAVDGVTVTVPKDDPDFVAETGYKPGQTVTLHGDKAEEFMRNRNKNVHFTNNNRMSRQKEYLKGFIVALKQKMKSNITAPVDIYNKASKYLNTDISIDKVSYIASMATGFSFSDENIYNIKGENKSEGELSRFIIDDKALYELIIDVFYEEIDGGGFVEVTEATTEVTENTEEQAEPATEQTGSQ